MVDAYFAARVEPVASIEDADRLRLYMKGLLERKVLPPMRGNSINLAAAAKLCGIPPDVMKAMRKQLVPIADSICRTLFTVGAQPYHPPRQVIDRTPKPMAEPTRVSTSSANGPKPRKRASRARPAVEFPTPLWEADTSRMAFADALRTEMKRHGDNYASLYRAICWQDDLIDCHTIRPWCDGRRAPRTIQSFEALNRIERRYRLPIGYFKARLLHPSRAPTGHQMPGVTAARARRLAWHLPEDFNLRSRAEQAEIMTWVQTNIISGFTEYRRFQASAARVPYAVRFNSLQGKVRRKGSASVDDAEAELAADVRNTAFTAPERLEAEMNELVRFKTSTLTALGQQRNGVWNSETASQRIEHFGLMFGAFAASPKSAVKGYGVSLESLTFGMLVFPKVWDWYLTWREQKRGFYTKWECDMLILGTALTRKDTGWLRQSPHIAGHLTPIPGLISEEDIAQAQGDWSLACDVLHEHTRMRNREIERVARIHRDPFEPILVVLEADKPVAEYRKITDEILRLMPDEAAYPVPHAEAVRSFLLLRLGLHLGLRQRNMRELLVCLPGDTPRSERRLEELKRGELRWSDRDAGWEVFIPSVAFKNAGSSFFGSKPFRLVLPDMAGLYEMIDAYLNRHRQRLLMSAEDPGTFFVKTAKSTSAEAAYNQNTFYEAWRLTIQRYGIYNPYTGNGAIKGLLPHGPHKIRDVLATHILKQTGSYEQASYAIQDTPEMVKAHYGRFLPQDKAAIAAEVLNRVWET
ncbi:hypothetical protein [Ferrovibrio xuzhouensis]|uniref:Uncharacterized protein n=1 Tax=Ferrovibrio xuzhouensis TaxID=1576914 RepID=A0ABV7VMK8_9PROT